MFSLNHNKFHPFYFISQRSYIFISPHSNSYYIAQYVNIETECLWIDFLYQNKCFYVITTYPAITCSVSLLLQFTASSVYETNIRCPYVKRQTFALLPSLLSIFNVQLVYKQSLLYLIFQFLRDFVILIIKLIHYFYQ